MVQHFLPSHAGLTIQQSADLADGRASAWLDREKRGAVGFAKASGESEASAKNAMPVTERIFVFMVTMGLETPVLTLHRVIHRSRFKPFSLSSIRTVMVLRNLRSSVAADYTGCHRRSRVRASHQTMR
jgi:hypothetical protein